MIYLYIEVVPKLWNQTIEAHRRAVHDAILETTATLVVEHGLRSVTMSQIAEEAGIGRATLYKYFPHVEAIMLAWHEQQVSRHLAYLAHVIEGARGLGGQLEAVLRAYALILHESHGHEAELLSFLHRGAHVAKAQEDLHRMFGELLATGVTSGVIRSDVAPTELASFCLHALAAAGTLPSKEAVQRLVAISLDGLRPRSGAVP